MEEESGYSVVCEINCVVRWFQSWNQRQRQEFLNDLVEKALPNKVDLLLGAMGEMNMDDRAPNIFQCQLRLFNKWFEEWTVSERNFMIEKLESYDPVFVEQFYELVRRTNSIS